MKTAKEHYQSLPEPERSQAMTNFKNNLDMKCERLSDAVALFSWANSSEGKDYWYEVYRRIANCEMGVTNGL